MKNNLAARSRFACQTEANQFSDPDFLDLYLFPQVVAGVIIRCEGNNFRICQRRSWVDISAPCSISECGRSARFRAREVCAFDSVTKRCNLSRLSFRASRGIPALLKYFMQSRRQFNRVPQLRRAALARLTWDEKDTPIQNCSKDRLFVRPFAARTKTSPPGEVFVFELLNCFTLLQPALLQPALPRSVQSQRTCPVVRDR
jgi:hypothetical protein